MDQGDYGRARQDLESALGISEKHGLQRPKANSLCDLAFAELGDGSGNARSRFREALSACVQVVWRENIAYCLVGCGAVAFAANDLDQAGHSLGQADRLCDDLKLRLEPYAQAVRDQVEQDLRSRVGEDRLEAFRAEGRSMSMEDAVSEAFAALDSTS
jgi:hypothetical protein